MSRKFCHKSAAWFWLRFFVFFCAFPLFLLNSGLDSYFDRRLSEKQQFIKTTAERKLLQLVKNADGSRFFNRLFQDEFAKVEINRGMVASILPRLKRLKEKFPGMLQFIVWDAEGNVVRELSDNTEFIFFLRKLNLFLKGLQRNVLADFPNDIYLSPVVSKQIRNFRQFLGPFISSAAIGQALIPTERGRCFQMHAKGRQAYGWYFSRAEFSLLIYISHQAINSMIGARELCLEARKNSDNARLYIVNEKSGHVFPEVDQSAQKKISQYLQMCINLQPDEYLRDKNQAYFFQKIKGNLWGLSIISAVSATRIIEQKNKWSIRFAGAIVVSWFVLSCFFLTHKNPFSSVRWKLYGIFIFAVALPLLVFALIGYDYMLQYQHQIDKEAAAESMAFLDRFDEEFEVFTTDLARRLTEKIDKNFWQLVQRDDKHGLTQFLGALKKEFSIRSVFLGNPDGKSILADDHDRLNDASLLKVISEHLLEYLNDRSLEEIKPVRLVSMASISTFADSDKTIKLNNLGQTSYYSYWYAFKSPDDTYYCLIQIFWDIRVLQRKFHEKFRQDFSNNRYRVELFFPESGALSDGTLPESELMEFFEKVEIRGNYFNKLILGKNSYFVAGKKSVTLDKGIACSLYPSNFLQQKKNIVVSNLLRLASLALLFSFCLMLILSKILFDPLQRLTKGVEKIRRQEFSHRLALVGTNEFGNLALTFNEALENLQEFAIARVVQESLLPDENFLKGEGFELYVKTCAMTRLGGDYYEYIVCPDGRLVVMVADVAGHGIQAALMMAMAKSAFYSAKEQNLDTSGIIGRLNEIFFRIRRSSIRTMMTCSIFSLTPSSGDLSYINAGHCSPLILSADGNEFRIPVQEAFPLGFSQKRVFMPEMLQLHVGETLLLFSDGIFESRNSRQEMLGMERFKNFIRQSSDADLESFYRRIISHYESFRHEQDDDITLMLVRRI